MDRSTFVIGVGITLVNLIVGGCTIQWGFPLGWLNIGMAVVSGYVLYRHRTDD